MERGLDQLIFFAFIVLAALVDWVVRVIRNRNAPPRPPVDEPDVTYYEDEAEYPEQEVERVPAPAPAAREVVFDAPLPAEWRRVLETRRVPEPEARVHLPSPRAALPGGKPVDATRWRREALGLRAPGAARRAIVMMAVLGPCRALENQPRW